MTAVTENAVKAPPSPGSGPRQRSRSAGSSGSVGSGSAGSGLVGSGSVASHGRG